MHVCMSSINWTKLALTTTKKDMKLGRMCGFEILRELEANVGIIYFIVYVHEILQNKGKIKLD